MSEKPHNTTWHKIVNETRPDQGEFWENDHFFNTPNKPGDLAPGEANCNGNTSNPAPSVKGCYFNMKAPSKNLTFSYDGKQSYLGNAYQAARNWSNAGAGININQTNASNAYIKFKDVYISKAYHNSGYGCRWQDSGGNGNSCELAGGIFYDRTKKSARPRIGNYPSEPIRYG